MTSLFSSLKPGKIEKEPTQCHPLQAPPQNTPTSVPPPPGAPVPQNSHQTLTLAPSTRHAAQFCAVTRATSRLRGSTCLSPPPSSHRLQRRARKAARRCRPPRGAAGGDGTGGKRWAGGRRRRSAGGGGKEDEALGPAFRRHPAALRLIGMKLAPGVALAPPDPAHGSGKIRGTPAPFAFGAEFECGRISTSQNP